eukprot:scaffold118919_cov35-Tisochrysis_lutea.AAC.1
MQPRGGHKASIGGIAPLESLCEGGSHDGVGCAAKHQPPPASTTQAQRERRPELQAPHSAGTPPHLRRFDAIERGRACVRVFLLS